MELNITYNFLLKLLVFVGRHPQFCSHLKMWSAFNIILTFWIDSKRFSMLLVVFTKISAFPKGVETRFFSIRHFQMSNKDSLCGVMNCISVAAEE